ncbi:hypothetical protein Clacol_004156 [Clathrus columnatus]|uniref:Uncharacterized protein n=1 Tax=Clathrus columnatus TaxID=1419009 RepID=A0AAV5A5Q8_9AGAM|nr:hypothetical protein Clacol_004156 [Clathrus columnatus]
MVGESHQVKSTPDLVTLVVRIRWANAKRDCLEDLGSRTEIEKTRMPSSSISQPGAIQFSRGIGITNDQATVCRKVNKKRQLTATVTTGFSCLGSRVPNDEDTMSSGIDSALRTGNEAEIENDEEIIVADLIEAFCHLQFRPGPNLNVTSNVACFKQSSEANLIG